MKLQTVKPLFIEIDAEGLYVFSPKVSERIRTQLPVVQALIMGKEPFDTEGVGGVDGQDMGISLESIQRLVELGFFVDAAEVDDHLPVPWSEWGSLAWAFHERFRDTPFILRGSPEQEAFTQSLEDLKQLPTRLQLMQHRDALLLPRVQSILNMDFKSVLEGRRTHRKFIDKPVELEKFSTLLHYTLGPLRFADARELGVAELRANVSGGARHETYGCVAVFNVEDVTPGLYLYDQIRQGLILIRQDISRDQFESFTAEQGFYSTAGFGIITVADSARMSWKYRNGKAYRFLMNNVGAVAQVFSMTATALGLGAAITGALSDSAIEDLLQVESPREFATFSMSCGVPSRRPDGLPADFLSPREAFPA